ncbi:DUF4185 domain-containing protein [Aeromicrobium stalagmiti]|uniref:DUF4185 domain-containing protein n=1 Tax=Aeromicrobium stalagmiti TaxID=2738988 RepID=UPI00156848CD|nr:DUF4185 domain-containing protein [Aeromicrobium stalagmiti]NRQ48911.1 DUF4185 domain-containing protein [Aeromicrobium stalagmiti]
MGIRRLPWRLRVALVSVPAAAAMFVAIAVAPGPADPAAPGVSIASETRCLPIERISTVGELNTLVETLRGGAEFQGADVGADVTLQDGRRLWVFGDTLRADDFEGQRFVRNSMLVFTDRCADVVLPADHGALIPDREDGVGYWPMSIAKVERTGYDLVGVAAQRVRGAAQPDGAEAFENLGPSLALFVVERGRTPQLLQVKDFGQDSTDTARTTWGAASTVHDGWVYLYGTASPGTDLVFGFSLKVARVRPDDILDTSRWRYWDGSSWQRSAKEASTLIPAEGGVSQTLSVFEQEGRWYAVSKRDEFLGTDLVIWSSPTPTGPFVAGPALARIPSEQKTGTLRYMPLAHPDLLPKKGTVVVSYSQNNTDIQKIDDDPFLYRPRFLRVDLPQ